jgi:predicted RNase H-like nuclease (RuvC/YqgF family)
MKDFREEAEKYASGKAYLGQRMTCEIVRSWAKTDFESGASWGYEVGKAERDDEALETVDKLIEQRDQLKQQLAEIMNGNDDVLPVQIAKLKQQLSELGNEYAIVCHLKQELVERDMEIAKLKEAVKWYKAAHELFAKHSADGGGDGT